ncbi:SMI1/KNR4 family protein [Capnocytophaga sp.]|uniref:SMI1/KNR4 family protein n=1 Tax=Capnocytophaga sp. TaxID=44737 RepID=UPI0026DD10ED|nr:SMI1/KNR4 family protein [Capnocytophaga sp.]MDO5106098.1 SMI1/KNR4 family protein [Capnocytophaga sp.]
MHIQQIKKLYALDATKNYGFTERGIRTAENRLGIRFPKELHRYYAELGKAKKVNASHNRLLPFNELIFKDDYLIIYEENQEVCFWGIHKTDLDKESPPVWVGNSLEDGVLEWHTSHQNLADFFLDMAFYNGTMGGLRYFANVLDYEKVSPQAVDFIQKNRTKILTFDDIYQYSYTDDFQEVVIICHWKTGEAVAVFVGTQNQTRFDALLELFGDENWSYTSYDD